MAVELFANNAQAALTGAASTGTTTLTVDDASAFPAASSAAAPPTQFRVRVEDAPAGSGANLEFMTVTDVAGSTFTVEREQEGTAAVAHGVGSVVTMVATAAALAALANPAVSGTPADGQTLVYDADLGAWIPGDIATAGSEITYAENVTGTATTFVGASGAGGTIVDIPGCAITVPPNDGFVWLRGQAFLQQTVLGKGEMALMICETTGGGAADLAMDSHFLPNVTIRENHIGLLVPNYRLGPTVATRTFKLRGQCIGQTGNTPQTQAPNLSTFGGLPSYLMAEAK